MKHIRSNLANLAMLPHLGWGWTNEQGWVPVWMTIPEAATAFAMSISSVDANLVKGVLFANV